jgi:hypothetical protein
MSGRPGLMLILLAAILFPILFPRQFRKLTLALLGKSGKEAVGRRALAVQPDTITLVRSVTPPSAQARSILDALGKAGFEPAGDFLVQEMSRLLVRFMVRPADFVTAAVYEHPAAGVWIDLYTHYEDGTSFTFSTARLGGGLDPRPGHPVERRPGLSPAALLAAFLTMRSGGTMKAVSTATVAEAFAVVYAESAAWRKRHGLSAEEVEKAGMECVR